MFVLVREDLLAASHLLWDWRPEAVQELLATRLIPSLARIYVTSSLYSRASSTHEQESEGSEGDDGSCGEGSDEEDSGSECESGDEGEADADTTEEANVNLEEAYQGPEQWRSLIAKPTAVPLTEPRFSTSYWIEAIPSTLAEYWTGKRSAAPNNNSSSATRRSSRKSSDNKLKLSSLYTTPALPIAIPQPNPYIPTSFDLIPTPNGSNTNGANLVDASEYPTKVVISDGLHMWYKADVSFKKPKVEIYVKLSSPATLKSVLNATQHDLLLKLLYDSLNEVLYTASMAELGCYIIRTDTSVLLRISGFHDRASVLLQSVLNVMYTPSLYLTEASFLRLQESLARQYSNETLKAHAAARTSRLLALIPSRFSSKQKLQCLESGGEVNLASLQLYWEDFFSCVSVDSFVYGNMTEESAVAISDMVSHTLPMSDLQTAAGPVRLTNEAQTNQSIVKLPKYPHVVTLLVSPDNKAEMNVCVELYYQLHPYELLGLTRLDLLEQLLTEPFFDGLRTKQQVRAVSIVYIYKSILVIYSLLVYSYYLYTSRSWATR